MCTESIPHIQLLLKVSDVKQHLKMFWSNCFKEMQVFKIKF